MPTFSNYSFYAYIMVSKGDLACVKVTLPWVKIIALWRHNRFHIVNKSPEVWIYPQLHVPSADCEYNGMRFELGERFPSPRDPCAECVCQAGSVECLSRVCAIPNCPSPTYSPGSCCPVCLGKSFNGVHVVRVRLYHSKCLVYCLKIFRMKSVGKTII